MLKLTMIFGLTLMFVGCAGMKSPAPDEMCGALKAFANAQIGSHPKSVTLKTCWSCGDSIIWKRCEFFDYKPGEKLCSFLIKNTVTEFPQNNFKRAISCLADKNYQPIQNALDELNHISYDFYNVDGISEGIYISIEFSNNKDNEELPTLIIETSGRGYDE